MSNGDPTSDWSRVSSNEQGIPGAPEEVFDIIYSQPDNRMYLDPPSPANANTSRLNDDNKIYGVLLDGTVHAWETIHDLGTSVLARVYRKDEISGDLEVIEGEFDTEDITEGSRLEYMNSLGVTASNKKLLGTIMAGATVAAGSAVVFLIRNRRE